MAIQLSKSIEPASPSDPARVALTHNGSIYEIYKEVAEKFGLRQGDEIGDAILGRLLLMDARMTRAEAKLARAMEEFDPAA
jgi:hypothetical protein